MEAGSCSAAQPSSRVWITLGALHECPVPAERVPADWHGERQHRAGVRTGWSRAGEESLGTPGSSVQMTSAILFKTYSWSLPGCVAQEEGMEEVAGLPSDGPSWAAPPSVMSIMTQRSSWRGGPQEADRMDELEYEVRRAASPGIAVGRPARAGSRCPIGGQTSQSLSCACFTRPGPSWAELGRAREILAWSVLLSLCLVPVFIP